MKSFLKKGKKKRKSMQRGFHFSPKKWIKKSMKEKDDEKRGKGEWGAMPPKKLYILNWKEI